MRVLLGEHWWLGTCCKGLWAGVLLQQDRCFRLCCLSGQLIRQERLLQASQGIVSNTVDQLGDQCEEPQTASGFCWVSWAALALWTCLWGSSGKDSSVLCF